MRIAVHEESFPERPAFDTAVSRALLLAVGEGRSPAALRLYDPGDVVAFSLLDRVQPGFREAVAAARAHGFDAVLRLAGGRAAVFTRETLGFAWCVPDPEPRATIAARFDEMASTLAAALRRLGVDARVGAVPGEYCPGDHSVNARGKVQARRHRPAHRARRRARRRRDRARRQRAHPRRARPRLRGDGLRRGIPRRWARSRTSSAAVVPRARVIEALLAELAKEHEWVRAPLPPELLAQAATAEAEHRL